MSVGGPRRCFCCGSQESTTGCVRGMLCDCNQEPAGQCRVCRYCYKHCACTDEMKTEALNAKIEYYKSLERIREANPDRINKRW